MNQQNLWYAILLLNFCILFPSKLIDAKVVNFHATANLSTSWINHPGSIMDDSFITRPSSFSPILYRESSNGSKFVCGFYSISSDEIADYVFGILIFNDYYSDKNNLYVDHQELVWSANRDRPVKINATMVFSVSGDLILKDYDETWLWSTNTAAKEITSLALSEKGNLVLHGNNDEIVWQSFDHPTDTLLPGQRLVSGQSLLSNTSTGNLSGVLSSIIYQDDGILLGYVSNPPQNYFKNDAGSFQYFDVGNGSLIYNDLASATPRFMKLDSDGHLKIYELGEPDWYTVADVSTKYIGECGYPLVCGKYGICSSGQQCSCPAEPNNHGSAFEPVDSRYRNLGCTSFAISIYCNDNSKSHTLLELKNITYLKFPDHHYEVGKGNITVRIVKIAV